MTMVDRAWTSALKDAGLVVTVEHFDWTSDEYRFLDALQAIDRNRRECLTLAERITFLARSEPHRRIILTAHSGGTGFVLFALERLPADVQVDTLVLMAPAISGNYDLSPALKHVRREAYVFTSRYDTVVLGTGTRLFGTMDGQKVDAAGLTGFTRPESADPKQYAKIVELGYQASWMRYSNFGDHVGSLAPSFALNIIGPLLNTGMLRQ
jgi:pimeloyl-ACP methyl ester carboxylesterase